jgi:hypothetical protein
MNFDGRSIAPEIATELGDGVFCAEAEPLNTGPNSATSSPMRRFLAVVLFNHGAARRVQCFGTRRARMRWAQTLSDCPPAPPDGPDRRHVRKEILGRHRGGSQDEHVARVDSLFPRMPESSNSSHVAE